MTTTSLSARDDRSDAFTSPDALFAALRNHVPLAVAFGGMGLMLGSWASRIPSVTQQLGLSWSTFGTLLFVAALGSFLTLPVSPTIVNKYGTAAAVRVSTLVALAGLTGIGFAQSEMVLLFSLLALGCGLAVWDVALNVEAAAADRAERVAIMLPLHGCFSLGAMSAAFVGTLLAQLPVTRSQHLIAATAIIVVCENRATRSFTSGPIPDTNRIANADPAPAAEHDSQLRYYCFGYGLIALAAALAEVVGSDWIALFIIDDYHAQYWAAGVGLGIFLTAMTTGRFIAILIVRPTWGLLKTSVLACLGGIVLVALAAQMTIPGQAQAIPALAGVALWGLGAAPALPWAMHEAGRDARFAASRVRVVQAVSSFAFLSPVLIGWVSAHAGHVPAFLVLAGCEAVLSSIALVTLGRLRTTLPERLPLRHVKTWVTQAIEQAKATLSGTGVAMMRKHGINVAETSRAQPLADPGQAEGARRLAEGPAYRRLAGRSVRRLRRRAGLQHARTPTSAGPS